MRDAHIRALTGARRMRPTSIRSPWRWRHEFSAAARLLQLRRATPSLRRTQHPATRNKRNPAERHLIIREKLFRQPEPEQLVALSPPGVRRSWDRPWGSTGDHENSYLIHDTPPNGFT